MYRFKKNNLRFFFVVYFSKAGDQNDCNLVSKKKSKLNTQNDIRNMTKISSKKVENPKKRKYFNKNKYDKLHKQIWWHQQSIKSSLKKKVEIENILII